MISVVRLSEWMWGLNSLSLLLGEKNPKDQETVNIRKGLSQTWKERSWYRNSGLPNKNIICTSLIEIIAVRVSIWVNVRKASVAALMKTHTGHCKDDDNFPPDKTPKWREGNLKNCLFQALWDTASKHCNMAEFMGVTNIRWQLSSELSARL